MGANLSCPPGFEEGGFFSCRAVCPPEFKFIQEGGGASGPPVLKCINVRRNNRFFTLNMSLRPQDPSKPVPPEFRTELDRVATETSRVLGQVDNDIRQERLLQEAGDARSKNVGDYSKVESDYAVYTEQKRVVDEIQKTHESLKPLRAPTAPSSDIEKERKEITGIAQQNLFFIQAALFLVVLALLCYVMFPLETANLIAFALITVGIAIGFFLKG
jgi:hypothetical protein